MAVSTYKAQLNYHDSLYGWGNEGTTSQGSWSGTGTRTGVMYFPGLSALKGKIINKVTFKTTNMPTGQNASKTAYFYRSANQGGIKTSLGAGHKTGNSIGSLTTNFHSYTNATSSLDAAFLAQYIAAGEDTFCIYVTGTTHYLKWSGVTLEVDWLEPTTQPILNKSSVTMGEKVTISTPATNSAYRHTLRYAFGKATGQIATGVASSYEWTPPVSLAAQIPSAVSDAGTIYCDTYNGSTLLGTKTVAITLAVPASVVPSAGTLSASVADDTSGTGLYVKGMGKARLRLTGAAGAQGSTIKSTKISGGGWTENDADMTTGVLTSAGTITFTATVTDSRGRTAQTTCSLTVLDYIKPRITSCSLYRCDSAGTKQNTGTYASVQVATEYSAISGNTLSITVAYKLATASNYGSSTMLSNNTRKVIGGSLAVSSTYDVLITVADKYNSVSQLFKLNTKSGLMSFLRNVGMAIGKVAEIENLLDVALPTRFRGKVTFDDASNQYAPAGYGLGKTLEKEVKGEGALDTVFENGWYSCTNVLNGMHGVCVVSSRNNDNQVQTFYAFQTDTYVYESVLIRWRKWGGNWGEWEWVNPPMALGVEYRTTEQWDGQAIYTTLIDCGATVNPSATIDTAINCRRIIRTHGYAGGYALPFINSSMDNAYTMWVAAYNNSNKIRVRVYAGTSSTGLATVIQLWYTKP